MLSLKYNFLFIHRGKTGGNSISEALLPFSDDEKVLKPHSDGIDRFDIENKEYSIKKHEGYCDIEKKIPDEIFRNLFKFTTIRNPFDRLISAYFSPHRVINKKIEQEIFNRDQFINELFPKIRTLREQAFPDNQSQNKHDNVYLIRFENLQEDFSQLVKKIGISENISLNHRNKSSRLQYQNYYDKELIDMVADKHAEEIELGGYQFD